MFNTLENTIKGQLAPPTTDPATVDPAATTAPVDATVNTDGYKNPIEENTSAVSGTVDDKSTVQGQITGLLNQNNDYMRRAETQGWQAANQRGLINTSMGAGAAQAARIDAALPIAQQDAETNWKQQQLNQEHLSNLETMAVEQGYTLEQMAEQEGVDLNLLRTKSALDETAAAADHIRNLTVMAKEQGYTLAEMAKKNGFDIKLLKIQANLEDKSAALKQIRDLELMAKEQGYTLAQMAEQQNIDLEMLQAEAAADYEAMRRDYVYKSELMGYEATIKEALMGVEQGYALELEELIQEYEMAKNLDTVSADIYKTAMQSLAHIAENKELSGQTLVNRWNAVRSVLSRGLEYLNGLRGDDPTANWVGSIGYTKK